MDEKKEQSSVFHAFNTKNTSPVKLAVFFAILIVLGIGVGYGLSRFKNGSAVQISSTGTAINTSNSAVTKGAVFGVSDAKTFKDTATGVLQKGGINGEGQYHLVRPGGDSQNVYLISSVVDLSKFIGHKITVNGQTQTAKYAGWLMDVGRVEVLQ